jgi:hypothetical protein
MELVKELAVALLTISVVAVVLMVALTDGDDRLVPAAAH